MSGRSGVNVRIEGPDLLIDTDPQDAYDLVWWRRPTPPVLSPAIAEADKPFAQRESISVLNAVRQQFGDSAFWVNRRQAAHAASSKPIQLQQAIAYGLEIPDTLISNNPDEIRRFFDKHKGDIIHKPFLSVAWDRGNHYTSAFTSRLPEEMLDDRDALRACPGIFQERIDKAYEVRLIFFGKTAVAVALDSQSRDETETDWRRMNSGMFTLPMRKVDLPSPILTACHRLLRHFGLVFGAFDLIVTQDGNHIFLEVNEGGQFLFLERAAPEATLLQIYTEFFLSRDADFVWQGDINPKLSYAHFLETVNYQEIIAREEQLHTEAETRFIMQE